MNEKKKKFIFGDLIKKNQKNSFKIITSLKQKKKIEWLQKMYISYS